MATPTTNHDDPNSELMAYLKHKYPAYVWTVESPPNFNGTVVKAHDYKTQWLVNVSADAPPAAIKEAAAKLVERFKSN